MKGETVLEHNIIELYESGTKIAEICNVLGIDHNEIYKCIKRYDIPKRNKEIHLTKAEIEDITTRFLNGEPNAELTKEYGLSRTNLYDILKFYGVNTVRPNARITKESREKAKKVKKYYNDGVPIKEIKEMTNLKSDNSIYQYVEANRKGKTNG